MASNNQDEGSSNAGADSPKKPAEKPTEANTDVEGGNGPVSTTA